MAEGRLTALHSNGQTSGGVPAVPDSAVRAELARILASNEFRTSRRCQDFLRYVVETSLDGKADQLKERTIGIDVFARPTAYDPSDDATVRVKAGEVRKRLGLFYAGNGRTDEVRIELPGGAYVPEFRLISAETHATPAVAAPSGNEISGIAEKSRRGYERLNRGVVIVVIAAALLALVFIFFLRVRPLEPRTVLDQFWEPVLQQAATPVVLSAAYVPVYTPNKLPNTGPPQTAADFTLLSDQFVGGGDMLAINDLAVMLTRMHRAYLVKIGTEVSFSDLRYSPTVLVGYSYTRWKEISRDMRFFMDADRRPLMILDNGQPTTWSLPHLGSDKRTDEDFAIVSRVFNADTRTLVVEVAGLTQYGTVAAAELVTNADLMREALKGAPVNWEKKNFQFVLHTKVISGMAASQQIVARYFW